MNWQIYCTPYRHKEAMLTGAGVPGTYNKQCVDCPFVFQHSGGPDSEDELHIRKAAVLHHNGTLYHYCTAEHLAPPGEKAARSDCEYRCIRLATNGNLNDEK